MVVGIAGALLNIALGVLLLFKQRHVTRFLPALALALLFPALSFVTIQVFHTPLGILQGWWIRAYAALVLGSGVLLLQLGKLFTVDGTAPHEGRRRVSLRRLLEATGAAAVVAALLRGGIDPGIVGNDLLLVLTPLGMGLVCVHLLMILFLLLTIETTYRNASLHQRRVGRWTLLPLGVIACFQLVFLTRALLYRTISVEYADALVVVHAIAYPLALVGMFRYRIAFEKVAVSRQAIYSSITLFAAGALLLGLGVTVTIVQRAGIRFTHFELFLGVFASAMFVLMVATSEEMRRRVVVFAGRHLYQRKYDYRDQFYRLHRTYMLGDDLSNALLRLTEQLKHDVAALEVRVFLMNEQDGNLYAEQAPEQGSEESPVIDGDGALVSAFEDSPRELDYTTRSDAPRERDVRDREKTFFERLPASAIFPIVHREELLGILAIRVPRRRRLDKEDRSLIGVFAQSIGNVVFRFRMLKERIERRQFDSFSRISAFVAHDIKNQVATLSLLARNAAGNIANPDFQQSLLRSLKDCTGNLQSLVDKLRAPLARGEEGFGEQDINALTVEAIDQSGARSREGVEVTTELAATPPVTVNRSSFLRVMANLISNAVEAMDRRGRLSIRSGTTDTMPEDLRRRLGITNRMLRTSRVYVTVSDTGRGMSGEFVRQKLFHPFSSTKDKGIGIGLYQSKTLVEEMGGKLLCHSREREGTTFCVLVRGQRVRH